MNFAERPGRIGPRRDPGGRPVGVRALPMRPRTTVRIEGALVRPDVPGPPDGGTESLFSFDDCPRSMSSLRDAESDLERALRRLEARTSYAEVMAEISSGHRLSLDREAVSPSPLPYLEGAVFRAWNGVSWVEAAASGLSAHAFAGSIEQMLSRLPATRSGDPVPGPSAEGRQERTTPERRPLADFGVEDRIAWARTCFGWATSVTGIENAFVNVATQHDERLFLSTAGAYRYQRISRALGSVAALAIEGGKVEFDHVQAGRTGGTEGLDGITETDVVLAAREARALLTAKEPPIGPTAVILDPSTSGTFAHESFGHGTEADQLLRERSYLAPLLGKEVGPETLTLVDDGSLDGGWGSIFFDDEGNPSHRTVLVDHGRFVEVLHDRVSAAALHRPPSGNARRADFLSRPFVRMTNTFVEPGDRTLDELVSEVKDGVLMQNFTSGIEDPLGGNMQLKVKKGRRIVRGELGEILPSMALSGKVLEFLRNIRGVSRASDFSLHAGFCGKGHTDILPTGAGGPYVLSRAVVGPA